MAKKTPRKGRTRKVAAPRRRPQTPEVSERSVMAKVEELNRKLDKIQKDEESALVSLLKETEAMTRSMMNSEMEIRRQKLLKQGMEESKALLDSELGRIEQLNQKLLQQKENAEKKHKKLIDANERLNQNLSNLEKETLKLKKDNADLSNAVQKAETQNDTLREDIERLGKLKEEYMKSVAKFRRLRDDLIP